MSTSRELEAKLAHIANRLEEDRRLLCLELARIKHRAGQLGMFRTMQALDNATNTAGYELADLLSVGRNAGSPPPGDCGLRERKGAKRPTKAKPQ